MGVKPALFAIVILRDIKTKGKVLYVVQPESQNRAARVLGFKQNTGHIVTYLREQAARLTVITCNVLPHLASHICARIAKGA